jgi:PIN domain nuclease of toxin-antitoxin system
MKYLIDTHVLIWVTENSPKLSMEAKRIILDKNISIYVSVCSFWEIAIKLGTGKIKIDGGLSEIERLSDENDFISLPLKREYFHLLPEMPFHHRDPFDRLLITSSIIEDMTLITNDENIQKYNLKLLW